MKKKSDFEQLHDLSTHARLLQGISSILEWDQETYMPSGSFVIRGEQFKTLAGLIHREKTSKKYEKALSRLMDLKSGHLIASELSPEKEAAVREWYRDYRQDTALPTAFVEEFAQLTSQATEAWRKAKKDNAFEQFAPFLDKIVRMNIKKAEYLGYKDHPYDALLDYYEPDLTTKEVSRLFILLRNFLTPLIKKISGQSNDNGFLFGKWNHQKQIEISHQILKELGYDFNTGRLDFSSHPFSVASHPTDSRITTRIHPNSLINNIMAILHEGGHAFYEMGLPQDLYGTPLGEPRSLGVHESQSRWWETRIGLSKPFWEHFLPLFKSSFKGKLDHISLDQFYRAVNKVEPNFIRVEADEVTYPMHVILRFEIEKSLIEGSIKVKEVPDIWNLKMKDYLGIIPRTNAEGCLQDIHWSMGSFGYFPTYTMGNLYAAHLFEGFAKDHPDWNQRVAKGDFAFIREWLKDKVHRHGRRYPTHELLEKAAGTPFSIDPYQKYIRGKYSKIYKL